MPFLSSARGRSSDSTMHHGSSEGTRFAVPIGTKGKPSAVAFDGLNERAIGADALIEAIVGKRGGPPFAGWRSNTKYNERIFLSVS